MTTRPVAPLLWPQTKQTPMRRCVHTPGRLRRQLGWPSSLFWLGVWCLAVTQTPSSALRHPSFKEEGAGKRCSSECGCETFLAEGLGSALGCQLPSRITVCCKMRPALNRDVTGAQGVLDGVSLCSAVFDPPAFECRGDWASSEQICFGRWWWWSDA